MLVSTISVNMYNSTSSYSEAKKTGLKVKPQSCRHNDINYLCHIHIIMYVDAYNPRPLGAMNSQALVI